MADYNPMKSILGDMKGQPPPKRLEFDLAHAVFAKPTLQTKTKRWNFQTALPPALPWTPPRKVPKPAPSLGARRGALQDGVGQQGMSPDLPNPNPQRYPPQKPLPVRVRLPQWEELRRKRRNQHLDLIKQNLSSELSVLTPLKLTHQQIQRPELSIPTPMGHCNLEFDFDFGGNDFEPFTPVQDLPQTPIHQDQIAQNRTLTPIQFHIGGTPVTVTQEQMKNGSFIEVQLPFHLELEPEPELEPELEPQPQPQLLEYTNQFLTAEERAVVKASFYLRGIQNPHIGLKDCEACAKKDGDFRKVWQRILEDKGGERSKAAATILGCLRNICKMEKVRPTKRAVVQKSEGPQKSTKGLEPNERLKIREVFYCKGQPIRINKGICQQHIDTNYLGCADILRAVVEQKGWQKALVAMRGTCKAAEQTDRKDAMRK